MATVERKNPRSRIRACWRLLFAIVGVLDCSCFCYCYYYHNDYFGEDNNNMATANNMQPPRSCSPREEWREHDLRQLKRAKEAHDANNKMGNGSYAAYNGYPERQSSSRLSNIVWHSMAFSLTADTANGKGTKIQYRHDLKNNNSYKIYHLFLLLHVVFGILCCIEMVLRAREARRLVFENQALAAFEEHIASTVAKAYHRRNLLQGKGRFTHFMLRRPSDVGKKVSSPITTGTLKRNPYIPSFSFSSHNAIQEETEANSEENENIRHYDDSSSSNKHSRSKDDGDDIDMDEEAVNKRNILLFLRSTFKLWLPIGVTCCFWLSLLPFRAYYRIIRTFLNEFSKPMINGTCVDDNYGGNYYCDIDCGYLCDANAAAECYVETLGDDTALATLWITACWARWNEMCKNFEDYLSTLWRRYLLGDLFTKHAQKNLHIILDRPKLIWFRLGRILKIIKWVRFAFPLARMVIKLQDQLWVGYSTIRNVRSARTNREKRLQRPSLLLEDLRRIESLHKVETTIAAWPSQCNMLLETLAKEVSQYSAAAHSRMAFSSTVALSHAEEFLRKSRERGRQITRQIQRLQGQLKRNMNDFSYSEIYDSILRLSQGVSRRNLFLDHDHLNEVEDSCEGNEQKNEIENTRKSNHSSRRSHHSVKSRWYDFLHLQSLLLSRDYLISPRSRFSVVWRITVTNCLLLELTRLSVSWHLTQTFHLSISQVIGRLFVNCGNAKEANRRNFKFVTDLFEEWHVGLSRAIPFVPFPKDSLWILCIPTSNFSKVLLLLGSAMETFIDVVSFLDIFFWFFTGDLDVYTGIVVPKPFFSRCILPGTLVQVIDHPTLPHFLPSVMAKLASLASELGWSRLVLWACALFPALAAEVILPLSSYFFRHYEERSKWDTKGEGSSTYNNGNDILMTCAESFGYLPTRSSLVLDRSTSSPLWFRGATVDNDWGESQTSSDNDNVNGSDNIDASVSMWPRLMHKGILSSPGSPRRNINHDSSVRFAKDLPLVPTNDESEDGSRAIHGSFADFDIGLSLSSHDLDDLNHANS